MHSILAEAADRFILPRFQKLDSNDIFQDGRFHEIITKADREASTWILNHCRKEFPASYSEEDKRDENLTPELLWQVDPLDGTHEFKNGYCGFTIQAALLKKSQKDFQPLAGIIYSPLDHFSVYGGNEIGIFRKHQSTESRILVGPISSVITIHARELDLPRNLSAIQKIFKEQWQCPVSLSFGGGAGNTFLQMLSGYECGQSQIYLFPRNYTSEWDLSAAESLFEVLGGWICDFKGQAFTYNRGDPKNRNGFIAVLGLKKSEVLPLVKPWIIKELNHD